MKLFVFELICAGGMGPQAPSTLRAEGWAMLAALVEDFDRVDNVETLTLVDHWCPRPVGRLCWRSSPGEERSGFEKMAALADLTLVVAPECDQLLAKWSRWALDVGTSVLGPDLAAIDLTGDKWALARHFTRHGIPTPSTSLLDRDVGPVSSRPERRPVGNRPHFPAICKPRHGAGSQATFLVRNEQELSRDWAKGRSELPRDDFLVQPFIRGLPASVSFLIGPKQRLALQPAAQHLSKDGRCRYLGGRLPLAQATARRASRLARRAIDSVGGLAGFVGVDLVLGGAEDGSQDWVIEINPRLTTSYVGLRQLAEDNLAEGLLRIARGGKIPPIRWRRGPIVFSAAASTR
jgi:predicted ATP-grasp superfamily ATP-dependent carboligase